MSSAGSKLRVHVTGVGDAFTERYHNASLCVEEVASGFRLQIDCPPAYPRVLSDYRARSGTDLSVDNIEHLLLTHLHGDHCGGTEAYLYLRRFVVGRKPTLYGAKEVLDELWPTRLFGGMTQLITSVRRWDEAALRERARTLEASGRPPFDAIADDAARLADLSGMAGLAGMAGMTGMGGPIKHLQLGDYTERCDLAPVATQIGPLRVERRFTRHHIPTTAVRIFLPGRSRPSLGYSADTAFDPDLIDWLAEADVVVHETNLGVHTPLECLLLLPAELKARMRLIHFPDFLDVASCPIACLREGESFTLE